MAYGLSVALLAGASLLAIPAMIRESGLDAWGTIASGQAVGVIGATVINYGWPIAGATTIASASAANRRREFNASVALRALLALVAVPATLALSALLVDGDPGLALAGAAMSLPLGLGFTWFFIGAKQPWLMLLLDTVPRVSVSLLATALMWLGYVNSICGALLIAVGIALGALISASYIARKYPQAPAVTVFSVRGQLRTRGNGLTALMAAAAFNALPIVVLNFVAPAQVAQFAIVERPFRQLLSGLSVFTNLIQGQLANSRAANAKARIRWTSTRTMLLVGPLAIGLLPIAWAMLLILAAEAETEAWSAPAIAVLTALGFVEVVLARASLPPLDDVAFVARATVLTSIPTILAIGAASWAWGALGALVALAFGLTVRVGIMYARVRRLSGDDR